MGKEGTSAVRALFTGTANSPAEHRPSVFDFLAEENLAGSLKGGFRTLSKLILLWLPGDFRFLERYNDELHLLAALLIENHHLKKYSASFSEHFYGLERILIHRAGASRIMTLAQRARSLACLVVVPYFLAKLEKLWERLKELRFRRIASRSFVFLYPYIRLFTMLAVFAFQTSYAFSLSDQWSPVLWLAGVHLRKSTGHFGADHPPTKPGGSGFLRKSAMLILWFPSIIGRVFSYGIFAIQFLNQFYASELPEQFRWLTDLESGDGHRQLKFPPPHPLLMNKANTGAPMARMDAGKCPICYRARNEDTVLSVSGYIFCYNCINAWVSMERRCPVTGVPATAENLIRIYPNASV